MRREVPNSFRQGAHMAGAIFMSNSETRELCFRHGVFGLPLEYEPFVNNVKKGMPLFLFDYTDRRLFGVFEAASDGGLNINRAAFRSGYSYPAQVSFQIVWKCRPLREDEFSHAIKENYYLSRKFYFDLSYQQVVRLYELFDKKRIELPISKYSTRANLEREYSNKGRPDKRSVTPDISPFSADQSHTLIPSSTPKVSTVDTKYSALTSMHPIAPPIFETVPSVSMPLVTEPSGVKFTPIPSSHHDQIKLPCHSNEHLRDGLTVNDSSTQLSGTCSQTTRYRRDQFVANQRYPLSHDYPYNSLSYGCTTQGPSDGVRFSSKKSFADYSLSVSQVPTGGDINCLCSTPYVPSYPQGNANWKDGYDINCIECREIYAHEQQHLHKIRSLTPPKLIKQDIPVYPEVPEVSAIGQQKESFTDYITIPDFAEDFENGRWKHGFSCNDSGSSGHGNDIGAYMSDGPYASHDIGAESNTTGPDQHPQNNVFSRLSLKQQPPQEITGPSLNQLVHSLSKRTKLWSSKNSTLRDGVGKQLLSEQVMDRPCPPAGLNLPSELEGEECTELPFLNFKRRSKATELDANLGKEANGKVKRRKLVRPSFGDNNNALCSGKELQGNGVKDKKHSQVESGGNKININFNELASVESDLVEKHSQVESGGNKININFNEPAVTKIQSENVGEKKTESEKPFLDTKEPNRSSATEVLNKQAPSLDNGDTISLDLNVADLNTMEKHSQVESGGNKININFNEPAVTKIQSENVGEKKTESEKPFDLDTKEPNRSSTTEVLNKQAPSLDNGDTISLDLNVADLNTVEKHSQVESGGNKININFNEPAVTKIQSENVGEKKTESEKPFDLDTKEPNRSSTTEVLNKQAPSLDNGDKISLDLNVADLNTMDESKLQAILGSPLFQALDRLRNGRPNNNSEGAGSSINGEDSEVKLEMNSSGSTKSRCN